ncbi:MAG: hypothetical protein B7Y25_02410 [Alphaproteobacteria bacterium 16-39-46]|nr:MAG: hypothetical protein B7Y25_02410 [Alphaproteobacteria bacterium 16-39-46]OZA43582.1 MAG: hypothetical protein B7X84_02725 [Alphaproteobacteria bacterium 17-39-52]HQS83767.1 virulence RhuM family protein [Alphaproteobacteria bacterium]HQS93523.1 virulence RhuM family protein [Alphaproteobacteria bacterium]
MHNSKNFGELLLYQTEDGLTRIEAKVVNETVWLTQAQLSELFQKDRSVITKHIGNIFEEGELIQNQVCAKFAHTAADGKTYQVDYYNLDVIISVGYRVKSHRGTQFRIWATQRLREYIIKGFSMDDERLKQMGEGNYFDELLARIRDIRSSERVFWRKILDIYSTSIDYDPNTESSKEFFSVIQNKMHWAAHGHTAAEIIKSRADAAKHHMGMTSFSSRKPKRTDAHIAKNYLIKEELETLNRLVNIYLEFAELRAVERRVMYMKDWVSKLDEFLHLSERDILTRAGKISNEDALKHANAEFDQYKQLQFSGSTAVDAHFEESLKQLEKIGFSSKKDKKSRHEVSVF